MVPISKVPPLGSELGHPSRKRDTSVACREKAKDNLMQAVHMPPGTHRSLLESSAAAWSTRAEQLQRREARVGLESSAAATAKRS